MVHQIKQYENIKNNLILSNFLISITLLKYTAYVASLNI
jgi:hypothetical protein